MTEPAFQRLSDALSPTYTLQRELGGGGMSRVYLAIRKAPDARARLDELVSRLWERLGDDQRAWKSIGRHYAGPGGSMFASARMRASAPIAERLGKRNEAIAALRTYVAIRAKADAAHQADLQDARATLARLEREGRGR